MQCRADPFESKREWPRYVTTTDHKPTHGIMMKRHRTLQNTQQQNTNEMITELEWTLSTALQN